jgi:hypothetical protein
MSTLSGAPSDDLEDVLATGRTDVTTAFVSLSGRDPDGRDAAYIAWHSLDHRPEQHRLDGLRGALRLVSTPACRAARLAGDERYERVDHVMAYLFAGRAALKPFGALGAALAAGGRMPLRLPSVEVALYDLAGTRAAPAALVGADVVPWRPATGAFLLVERVEQGAAPPADLTAVPGVAGAWWFAGAAEPPSWTADVVGVRLTWCFLDGDPAEVAGRLRAPLERRWDGGAVVPLLAAPFHVPVPFDWGRHLP